VAHNPEAQTAFGPMVLSAVEQQEAPDRRLVDDGMAAAFLPGALRILVKATRFAPLRHAMVAAAERTGPGLWASLACRKHYIDDNLEHALADVDAVVILGAGFDTRAYRLARLSGVPIFEVDQPLNVERKAKVVARVLGSAPRSVRLVPVDFERDDLMAALAVHGYRPEFRTFFVWEGVTQYLTESAVRATFTQLTQAAAGSRLDFTYVQRDFIDGTELYDAPTLYRRMRQRQQVWKFGIAQPDVADFIAPYGWRLIEQAGPEVMTDRYVRPADRSLTVSGLEWSAYAEKT
jgi:methyltransferase (TIGR00027 family)